MSITLKNPMIEDVQIIKAKRTFHMKAIRQGIIKYLDVYKDGVYAETLICEPLSVIPGDNVPFTYARLRAYSQEVSWVSRMYLPSQVIHNWNLLSHAKEQKQRSKKR